MFETLVSFVMVEHLYGETFKPALDTAGYKRVLNKERRPYPSKDGYFALLPYTDGHWKEFCILVGREDLAKDPRFQGMANRLKNVEQYYATLAGLCAERTNAEWVELLKNSNVPHGPVNTLDDLFKDPQLNATGYWQDVDHPTEGRIRTMAVPTKWSRSPPEVKRQAPRLGQHSVEVLKEVGYSDADIAAMIAAGNAISQQESPPDMRGRLLALTAVAFLGSTPIGGPITGLIADYVSLEWSMAYGGLTCFACVAVLAWWWR